MLTLRKARALISPGDVVFSVCGGEIVEHIVQKIRTEYIESDLDCLFYDECPGMWFLTLRGALDSIGRKE